MYSYMSALHPVTQSFSWENRITNSINYKSIVLKWIYIALSEHSGNTLLNLSSVAGENIETALTKAIACRGTGKAVQKIINVLASRATEEDINILSSCLRTAARYVYYIKFFISVIKKDF